MIGTVLRNLISNAVKFTNSGDQILIDAQVVDQNVEICVSDTGIGIAEKNIEMMFKIDSHLSTPGTADETGTGLGLIISREFVEKNSGAIFVKSTEGKGAEFKFTIPVYKD